MDADSQRMVSSKAIGIDLGTTYSCVAVWKTRSVEVIPNSLGNRTTPSCVSFSEHELLVGDTATSQATTNPLNTIFGIKRLIGRKFDDPEVQADIKHFPFQVCNKGGKPYVKVEYRGEEKELSPEEISAMVLMKMKETAESYLKTTVNNCCISVPARFNRSQRQATINAGTISGMHVLRLIDEPSAAAMAYGLDHQMTGERNVLLLDLGGGTLDVSLLTIEESIFEVKATAGNSHLGGEDFDNRLVNYFTEEFKYKNKKDLSSSPRALRRLRTACERAKRNLSSATQAFIEIDSLFEDTDFYTSLTRSRFEEMCQDLFCSILDPIEKVLRDSKVDKTNVNEVVLVGGSTRIPQVVEIISNFFNGKEPKRSVNPEEAVARGVAIQAAILSGNTSEKTQDLLLFDVVPRSLGIWTPGGIMKAVIKRNTTFPTVKSETFSTFSDNETEFLVQVYEGEHARTRNNTLLGNFTLCGIPPAPRLIPQIEVTFDLGFDGVLNVSATDKTTSKSIQLKINDKFGLSKREIERMFDDAQKYKAENEAFTAHAASKNNLELYLYRIRDSLTDNRPTNEFRHADKMKLMNYVNEIISWFEDSPMAAKEVYEEQQKRLEIIVEYEKRPRSNLL